MFGFDVRAALLRGFVPRSKDHSAGPFGVPLEHRLHLPSSLPGQTELLVPGGLRSTAVARDHDFHYVRLAISRSRNSALQRFIQVAARFHPLASYTLAFGKLYEIDVRVAQ